MSPVFTSKVRHYAMYTRDVLARLEQQEISAPFSAAFFHVSATRGEECTRLHLLVSGPESRQFSYAITRAEVEALRNMLGEVLDDWKD